MCLSSRWKTSLSQRPGQKPLCPSPHRPRLPVLWSPQWPSPTFSSWVPPLHTQGLHPIMSCFLPLSTSPGASPPLQALWDLLPSPSSPLLLHPRNGGSRADSAEGESIRLAVARRSDGTWPSRSHCLVMRTPIWEWAPPWAWHYSLDIWSSMRPKSLVISWGEKCPCQGVFWVTVQALILTLDGHQLVCTALTRRWEPKESLGRSLGRRSEGSTGVQASALWPHGGTTTPPSPVLHGESRGCTVV